MNALSCFDCLVCHLKENKLSFLNGTTCRENFMSLHDPIADLLTRIRNASRANHRYVDVPWSRMNQNIVQVLKDTRFVEHFLVKEEDKKSTMRIFLRYTSTRESVIRGIKRISSPGCRQYIGHSSIPRVFN